MPAVSCVPLAAPARSGTGRVRTLTDSDLSSVETLARRVIPTAAGTTVRHLRRLLLDSPWRDGDLPSLVYEHATGEIAGFLGILPRPMTFRGRPVRAAVGCHFMVHPDHRASLAALELARRFLGGPQDLTLAEGNEFSRHVWQFFGGSVSLLYSLNWTRALRPTRYALTILERRGLSRRVAGVLTPASMAIDAGLYRLPQKAFRFPRPQTVGDELDAVTLAACLSTFSDGRALRPCYDVASVEWLLAMLEAKTHRGRLQRTAVRAPSGRLLGWYLYHLGAAGIAEVVQMGGHPESMTQVLGHLFYETWQRGAVAVSGQLDPGLLGTLSESSCAFHRPLSTWTLVHARDPQILNALHAGDAFLTRLEGEWWIAA